MDTQQVYARRRKLFVILLAVAAIGMFGYSFSGRESGNRRDTAPEYSPPRTPAVMTEAEDLYSLIGNDRQFTFMRNDITAYGRLMLPKDYLSTQQALSMRVLGPVTEDNVTYSFRGVYTDFKDPIVVTIKKLGSDRISTSITNEYNNGNVDSQLPSNSKQNQFLGTLPITTRTYKIEYNSSVNAFTITALVSDPGVRQEAEKVITDGMGQPKSSIKTLFKPFLW